MKLHFPRATWFKTLVVIVLCTASFSLGWVINSLMGQSDLKLITMAHQLVLNESLFNQQSSRDLSYAAVRGMLSVTGDPYAELIEPQAAQDFTATFAGQTGVIGMYADNQDGRVVVEIVFPGGPAEKAGLRVGDVILAIDGNALDAEADSSETGLLIRGTPGTTVQLEIQRGDQVMEFEILRQEREFVAQRMLPDGIGYISLNAFNVTASQSLQQGLEALLAQQPTGLIWDLRSNEGGDMQAAQTMLSYFIEDGLLFTAKLTRDRLVEFTAQGEALAPEIPLVVLMDESTYSAAETAAIAIAETGRGTTVGSHSYGKGIIQATIPLRDGALLQITIARWFSPAGEWFQERGVPPQVSVSDDPATEVDEVLQKGIEILLAGQ